MKLLNDKETMKIILIIVAAITLAFLIIGLILIGVSKLALVIAPSNEMGGFKFLESVPVGKIISGKEVSSIVTSSTQFGILKAGVIFSVILTPMFATMTLPLIGYYCGKFMK